MALFKRPMIDGRSKGLPEGLLEGQVQLPFPCMIFKNPSPPQKGERELLKARQ